MQDTRWASGASTAFGYNAGMKFQSLAIGQKFAWNDRIWVKTTPLVATLYESDVQKLVPRYVDVSPLPDASSPDEAASVPPLSPDQVREAFDRFYGRALTLLESELETELQQRLATEMENLRRHFLKELEKPD